MKMMAFADNVMVREGSKMEEDQEQMDEWEEIINRYGTKFNVAKCE